MASALDPGLEPCRKNTSKKSSSTYSSVSTLGGGWFHYDKLDIATTTICVWKIAAALREYGTTTAHSFFALRNSSLPVAIFRFPAWWNHSLDRKPASHWPSRHSSVSARKAASIQVAGVFPNRGQLLVNVNGRAGTGGTQRANWHVNIPTACSAAKATRARQVYQGIADFDMEQVREMLYDEQPKWI